MQIIKRILKFRALTTQIYTLMKLHYSFWSGALLLMSQLCLAQIRSGQVTDENNLPLPGATVIVEGTSRGTTTDFDGNYQIEVQNGQVLVFSYVGYADQKITVGATDRYDIQMQSDTELEEIIVTTAYGEQRKISVVGTIATITNELIENVQSTSVIGAIQGSIPGVNMLTQGGVPGTNPILWIRGTSSINADPNPLYVIDGVPFAGNINTISSHQIKSISVLKDASATALYGARGANGVILMTTQRGKLNTEPKIVINSNKGVNSNAIRIHNMLNNQQYMELTWEAIRNKKLYSDELDLTTANREASEELVPYLGYNPYSIDQPIGNDGRLSPNAQSLWETDWQKALLRDSGSRSEHSVSLTGGGKKSTYFSNVNYLKEDGQVKTTNFERISARLGNDSEAQNVLFRLQSNRDPQATASGNSGNPLLKEILVERRKELYGELGIEWFDAKRLRRGITRTGNHRIFKNLEPDDNRFFLKIPQAEIDANENIKESINSSR